MRILFKRLNKMGVSGFLLGLVLVFSVFPACKKKDRLSASTFQFSVTPPASSVTRTETLTLTAHGTGDINPTWAVSASSLGTVSPSFGTSVVFTPSALGDVVVTATFDGLQANSQIAVVTYKPNSNTFDVYNDDGLPTGTGIHSDIFVSGLTLQELSAGYTPEGIKYQRATNAPSGSFWGVTLDDNAVNETKDLSAFSSGRLKFALRLNRTLASGETLRIELSDLSAPPADGYTMARPDDFSGSSTDWQEIALSIPEKFGGLNLSQVKVPFAVIPTALASNLSFDVDAVRWEK